MARSSVSKWFVAAGLALCSLGASNCLLSFDHYAEGDVCAAGRDAGIRPSTAPDPVLRGCDAGPEREPEPEVAAAGAEGDP